ncbi:hypothetical protein OAF61_01955 [Pseudomonadales bacterium]|nr:hypothetical protein [Pseudomonadales bacterium]
MSDYTTSGFRQQIENRNFLSPTGFHFSVVRAPKVSYFGYQVNVPGLDLGVVDQRNYLSNIPRPGENIEFGDLTLTFLVDENLENYLEIQNWMRGIGFPESLQEIYRWQNQDDPTNYPSNYKYENELNLYSDGTLAIYNSSDNPQFKVVFENLFPYSLSPLNFDSQSTDVQYLSATVNFKYTIYNIDDIVCC